MDLLFETSYEWLKAGKDREFVTGNNDADAVYFLHWVARHFPDKARAYQSQTGTMGRQCLRRQCRQYRQSGQCTP